MNEELLRRGTKLERYEIRELIGQGGMGDVYRAWDLVLQRDVAMKVLRVLDPDMLQRFEREAEAIGKLDSENVVQIHDFRLQGEYPFIVMEFLHGTSLRERLVKDGAMEIEAAVDVALGVCRGVAACHRVGVIHRDLKPANVFLAETAHYGTVVKVLDFGVAKPRTCTVDVTEPGMIAGTPAYVPPEILHGVSADESSDQYGIGLLLYSALIGKPPFANKKGKELRQAILDGELRPPMEARPDLPEDLGAVLLRAISTERAARYPSVAALGRALAPFASEEERAVSGDLGEENRDVDAAADAPTAVQKVPPFVAEAATVVTTAAQLGRLARQMRERSATAIDNIEWSGTARKSQVVVPVAPMEESRPRVRDHLSHVPSSSTKVDAAISSVTSGVTHTHVGGVIETGKKQVPQSHVPGKPVMVLGVVAAALLAVAATIILVRAPVGPVKVELPERNSVSVIEEDNKPAFLDGGLGDGDGIPPLAEKTSASTANGAALPNARAAGPGRASGARQPSRMTPQRATEGRDGGTLPVIPLPVTETHATEDTTPGRDRDPTSLGRSLGRPPAGHHARRFGRTDEGAGHRQNKRRLEYTKDGSPILW